MNNLTLDQIVEQRRQAVDLAAQVDEVTVRMVFFTLADHLYAVEGAAIREILPLYPIAYVPGCPASMLGVINVRGDLESVISLAGLLGVEEAKVTRYTSILLAQAGDMRSGLVVDAIFDVAEIPESVIQPAPATTPSSLAEIVTGTVLHRDKVATQIKLDHLFHEFARGLG